MGVSEDHGSTTVDDRSDVAGDFLAVDIYTIDIGLPVALKMCDYQH